MASATVFRTASPGYATQYQPNTAAQRTELALQLAAEHGIAPERARVMLRRFRPAL